MLNVCRHPAAGWGVVQCILDFKHFECIYGFDGLQPKITCYFGGLLSLGVVLEKSPGGPLNCIPSLQPENQIYLKTGRKQCQPISSLMLCLQDPEV